MKQNDSTLCRRAGMPHVQLATSRRQFLASAGAGFGAVALQGMLAESAASASSFVAAPGGHHPATAKSVIFLFMEGGPSQLDTFDRKPLLNELAGKPLPEQLSRTADGDGRKELATVSRRSGSGPGTVKVGWRSVIGFRTSRSTPMTWRSFALATAKGSITPVAAT